MESFSFTEAHYCTLESQSNIYSLADINLPNGLHKVLIASLRGDVQSTEFQKKEEKNTQEGQNHRVADQFIPVSKEVQFTYIPGGSEIVAIDAFTKSHHGSGIVVGITFVKNTEETKNQYLNIYSECQTGAEFDLDKIAQCCQNLELNCVPFHLTHAELFYNGCVETVFLLSGEDIGDVGEDDKRERKIHLFRAEDRYMHTFQEQPTEEFFPEFNDLSSNVVWLHCVPYDDYSKRISAVGCVNGFVQVSVVDCIKNEVLRQCSTQHDSMITTVQLFTHNTSVKTPPFVSEVVELSEDMGNEDSESPEFHLLVTSAAEPVVVYRNVQEKRLNEPLVLADSENYDCVMCGRTIDLDFDGENEILIGTYGQELLAYKFYPKGAASSNTSLAEPFSSPGGPASSPLSGPGSSSLSVASPHSRSSPASPSPSPSGSALSHGEFRLLWKRSMPDPIFYVSAMDITGDGLNELVVLSLKGLHILQYKLEGVASLAMERLYLATQQPCLQDDAFKQLLSENLADADSAPDTMSSR